MRLVKLRDECRYSVSPFSDASAAIKNGGGGCYDFAATLMCLVIDALKEAGINRPVYIVGDKKEDHAYILIGNPADPKYGMKNTVVGDVYTTFFAAHTLEEAERAEPNYENPEDEYDPEEDLSVENYNKIHLSTVKRESDEAIIAYGQKKNLPPRGPELLHWVSQQNKKLQESGDEASNEAGGCFDDIKTAKDLSTVYKDADGNMLTFENFPENYIHEYLEAREQMEESGFPDNFQPKQ